jgi:hypothetical protein
VELSVVQQELTKALREARLASAAKLDATLGLSDARALRLDALRAELAPIVAANAEAKALFDLNLQVGEAPKLWLDLISSVVMEPDPRTYRLVQDQENRRETLYESTKISEMSAHIVKYYVWITGAAFGVLGLMIAAMLLGKLNF